MSTSRAPLPPPAPAVECILSPCSMAAQGLSSLIGAGGRRPTFLFPQAHDAPSLPDPTAFRRIVVFLPDDPFWLLFTLRQAALLLDRSASALPMLILSRSPAGWLWQTLLHLVSNRRRLAAVKTVASDLPCRQLASLLSQPAPDYPSLETLACEEATARGIPPTGLSKPEFNAALDWLRGYSITRQAELRGVSHKTLYNQRLSGLKKMVEQHPHLANRFPGGQAKGQKAQAFATLSAFEREFVHAIHCRQVFPVFQPITDGRLMLKGIEVLSRWRRSGSVLLPGEFLPLVRAEYAWLLLTAFALREAVQGINQHRGEYYFSVNVPPVIAGHDNLMRMMEAARQQLGDPRWAERLVLEFAETVDLNRQGKIGSNIVKLQQQGFRIMLDDCFSQSSVMFPVRAVRFSEYKLDMSIVNDFQHDAHALALVKSLIYYCQLTGSRCVAEGVDSLEKLNMLKALGIDRFQGYLISPPVSRENLDDIFQRFSPGRYATPVAG
ncbi:EAL domain-containing protein [Raoultella terrigena]|uniref:EAL domain-containing protein n=1 Tax=Raoultella terrigena TaxID=577 RepID=UPI003F62AD96